MTTIKVSNFMSLKSVNIDIAHKTMQSGINGVRIIIPRPNLKAAIEIPITNQIVINRKSLYLFLKSLDNPAILNPFFFLFYNY